MTVTPVSTYKHNNATEIPRLSKYHLPIYWGSNIIEPKSLSLNISQKAVQSGTLHYVLLSALVQEPATEQMPCGIWDSRNSRVTKDSSEMLPHVIC